MDTEEWSMNAFIFFLLFQFCTSIDTIMPTKFITDGDILVSTGEKFALGFFSPGSSRDRYLGIWYNKISEQTPVWVANRETPLKNSNGGVVTINGDGNLVVFDRNQNSTVLWSTNVTNHHNDKDSIAKLLDSGNLVLIEAHSQRVLWQSFDYPADTFIPGMTLGQSKKMGMRWLLTSWKSRNDPARGNYWYALDPRGSPQFFVYKGLTPYWRSGPWIGKGLNGLPEMARPLVSNVSLVNHDGEVYITYSLFNDSILSRIILDETGSLHVLIWIKAINRWNSFGRAPRDRCDDYGHCGPYGRCTTNDVMECECLPGFEPKSLRDWNLRDWSAGCVRKRVQECGKGEGFLKLSREKVPDTLISLVDNSLNLKECKKKCLSNCSCKAYTNSDFNGGGIGCITWYGELMDIREFINGEQDLYVRVDSIEIANARKSKGFLGKKRNLAILVVAIVVGLFLLVSSGYCLLKKMIKKKGVTENQRNPDMSLFNLATSATSFGDSPGAKHFEGSRRNPELQFFDLSIVIAATDNFSLANKLGQGGFGPVYKGRLSNGKEIAVKRLSKNSGQGMEEFKNEVMLIAKLQHRNLVRLLGCCSQEEEKMLIYEYMPNKSLDFFIFEQTRKALLDWRKRFQIISGIARGVLYLHQDSRLRIIHRDLKASNVLLDDEMNPKISDFGMARIFGGDQMQANTNRVVGTYGYMSPEYAMNGLFSVKSDVFSFGVLLLEIISGKRNNGHYHEVHFWNLIKCAWDYWSVDKALDLVDSSMPGSYHAPEVLRCIHVGLLCVQESAADRPPMSTVVFMLGNETTLPPPKQPAFITGTTHNGPHSSTTGTEPCSINEVTITMLDAR